MATWQCRFCFLRLGMDITHCSTCGRHWRQAQLLRSKSKKSESRREKSARRSKTTEEGEEEQDLFAKVPWVPSTPRTRVPIPGGTAVQDQVGTEEAQPPTTTPPTTAPSVAIEDSGGVKEQIAMLRKAMATSPAVSSEMQAALVLLEKEAGVADIPDKPLTHAQLNGVAKAQKQIKALKGKIEHLDTEWEKFSKSVHERYIEHHGMYQQHRQEIFQQLKEKQKGLATLQKEIQQGSQRLMEGAEEDDIAEEPLAGTLQTVLPEMIDLEMKDVELEERKQALKPFAKRTGPTAQQSPTKVSKTGIADTPSRSKDGSEVTKA